MKANRKFVNGDEAVSPVIAVILMVAITVVLAATVYLFVSGFGSDQNKIVSASFAAKAVDLPSSVTGAPSGDSDTSDDVIELTYTSGTSDFTQADVNIILDGVNMSGRTTGNNGFIDNSNSPLYCTNLPSGSTQSTGFTWARGASLFLWKANGSACGTAAASPGLDGVHLLKVTVQGQVVLDTQLEVHDSIL